MIKEKYPAVMLILISDREFWEQCQFLDDYRSLFFNIFVKCSMKNNRPPYLVGILCLFPLIGFFVGSILLLLGIFKYRDKKLIIIGSAGVLISIAIYSSFFYYLRHGKKTGESFAAISQIQLNKLANAIEIYKLKTGHYPDSLPQLNVIDPSVDYDDALLVRKMDDNNTVFQYRNMEDSYKIFSVGIDRVANTKDDIYPTVSNSETLKYGFVHKK